MRGKKNKRGLSRWILFLSLLAVGLVLGLLLIGPLKTGDDAETARDEEINDILKEIDEEGSGLVDEDALHPDDVKEEETTEPVDEIGDDVSTDPDGSLLDDEEEQEYDVIKDGDYLLALVTKETKLKSDYVPSDLEPIPSYMNPSYDMYLRTESLEMLKGLWHAAEEDGITLSIRSAYRSYSTQEWLFSDYASRHGEEEANRFSARPGQSEHQLGTTVDFGGTAVDFSAEFATTDQGKWLAENAHRFGFAMSYPEGKEDITGYIFEPWHYRYIGVDAAQEWKQSGKTLREFLETKPQEYE